MRNKNSRIAGTCKQFDLRCIKLLLLWKLVKKTQNLQFVFKLTYSLSSGMTNFTLQTFTKSDKGNLSKTSHSNTHPFLHDLCSGSGGMNILQPTSPWYTCGSSFASSQLT